MATKYVLKNLSVDKKEKDIDTTLVSYINSRYTNHPNKDLHPKMAYWKAFYEGNQYVELNENRLVRTQRAAKPIHRSKYNVLKYNAHIAVSKLLKEAPQVSAIPNVSTNEAKEKARAVNYLLNWSFNSEELDLLSKIYDAELTAYQYGTGWLHTYWNVNKYDYISEKSDEAQVGDVDVEVLDGFQVFADPTAKEWDKVNWIIYAYMANVEDLKNTYPDVKDDIEQYGQSEIDSNRQLYKRNSDTGDDNESHKNMALVLEYWERPNVHNKKGKKVVVINKKIIAENVDNPYADLGYLYSLPFIPFFWDKTPDKFDGNSALADQIPIQKEINMFASLIAVNAKMTAMIKIGVPKGSVKESDWNNLPGVFEYNNLNGGVPITVGGQPMPSYVQTHLSTLQGMVQDLAGNHEVSLGQLPERGSHMTTPVMKMLVDSEAVRHAPNMRRLKSSLKHLANMIIRLMKKYYKEPRYKLIFGDGGYELKRFLGSDLKGEYTIHLQTTSMINNSSATKIENALNLWDRGIPQAAAQGDKSARKMLEVLEFGTVEDLNANDREQRQRAEWFLQQILDNGEVPQIYDADDHEIHLEVLGNYIISRDFQDLEQSYQEVILQAYDIHKKMLEEKNKPPQQEGMPAPPPMNDEQQAMAMGGMGGAPPAM